MPLGARFCRWEEARRFSRTLGEEFIQNSERSSYFQLQHSFGIVSYSSFKKRHSIGFPAGKITLHFALLRTQT